MTPERLAKVRAIAEDVRGDPKIRAIAQRILAAHKLERPIPPNPPHPGLRTSEEYDRYIFLNLDNWHLTPRGNYVYSTKWKGHNYRFVLFRHKKTPTWGWLRVDEAIDTEQWGRNKYATVREAHESAWLHLTLI